MHLLGPSHIECLYTICQLYIFETQANHSFIVIQYVQIDYSDRNSTGSLLIELPAKIDVVLQIFISS